MGTKKVYSLLKKEPCLIMEKQNELENKLN